MRFLYHYVARYLSTYLLSYGRYLPNHKFLFRIFRIQKIVTTKKLSQTQHKKPTHYPEYFPNAYGNNTTRSLAMFSFIWQSAKEHVVLYGHIVFGRVRGSLFMYLGILLTRFRDCNQYLLNNEHRWPSAFSC